MTHTLIHTAPAQLPGRNDPCWCGSGKKFKKCHQGQAEETPAQPAAKQAATPWLVPKRGVILKSPQQIEGIRQASRATREILDFLEERVRPGITTGQINTWVHQETLARGGVPGPLHYKGFPKSVCVSVNEVVCHGIPGDRVLHEGDIVNVDVTTNLNGFFGDASRMYLVGQVSPEARRLVQVTRECLERGIAVAGAGHRLGDIGHAIQTHAESAGYSVVRDFVGHGVGLQMHEEPQVPHFGRAGQGAEIVPGMVFTIEPMINQGSWKIRILDDEWTAVTADGQLSAQYEHTLAVTESGVEILTG
ncbi:MAG: type I methionyl aminopeptidase [Deltaproteobacteria bacterium]|nr:type I methionyl aminopeptidase [Deltaproteobacteria bacterium]